MGIKCPKCYFGNADDTIYCGKCVTPLQSSAEISALTEIVEESKEEITTCSTLLSLEQKQEYKRGRQ